MEAIGLIKAFIGVVWIAFVTYWLISSFGSKKSVRGPRRFAGLVARIAVAMLIVIAFRGHLFHQTEHVFSSVTSNVYCAATGLALIVVGLSFAVWARVNIGNNWGMPMTLKEEPELITSGPYAFVRHPIYSGILFAMAASIIVYGIISLMILLIAGAYFVYSAKREEANLVAQMPDAYPAYKQRSKMLIPFVF
jgi:protein-S-isoprenylcysteine O-methyltransferase Ste14